LVKNKFGTVQGAAEGTVQTPKGSR